MYPIGSATKALFDANQKQVCRIRMDTATNTYNLTEADIIAGSFSIDRYSITGTRIEIGSACAGECKFKLKNYTGQWNSVKFEGAQLFVEIGIADWENYQSASDITWIPCGYFTIDAPVKNSSILAVEALDRMAKLDKPADWSQLTSATTVQTLISRICDLCDVILANGSAVSGLPNASYRIVLPTDEDDYTYRNLLQAACMLTGTCAFFNYNGLLELKWYTNTSVSIDETKRYNHEIQENDITITGVYFYKEIDESTVQEYLSGTKDYAFDISENPLLGDNVQGVVTALGTALNGFTYRPVKATVKPAPYLYPMDKYSFLKAGTTYNAIVSNVTVGLNANTSIEGKGETKENNGYATYGTMTNVQSKIVEYAKTKVDKEINDRTMLLMNLNEMVMNSLGLYETTLPVSGGGYQYYFHDASTLANSTIIYTFDANGFAWTDDWNDGDPVWNYGITRDGNAIINMLSAYKISADIITAGTMRAVNLIFGTEPNTTELRTNDQSTGALFEGTGVMQFETKGEFRAKNLDSNDYEANRLLLTNNGTESNVYEYNFFNNATANIFNLSADSTKNKIVFTNLRIGQNIRSNECSFYTSSASQELSIKNYEQSYATEKMANRIFFQSKGTSNYCYINNYKVGQVDSSNDPLNANRFSFTSSSTSSLIAIENWPATRTSYCNYIHINATSTSQNISLWNSDINGYSQSINLNENGMELYSGNSIVINAPYYSGTNKSGLQVKQNGNNYQAVGFGQFDVGHMRFTIRNGIITGADVV